MTAPFHGAAHRADEASAGRAPGLSDRPQDLPVRITPLSRTLTPLPGRVAVT